jgi:hypothetical protein
MAINWGRMARGVATGYLSAKIANTEANDKLNADIHKAAGVNFYTNTLPDHQKRERVREREFKQISNFFGSDDAANYFGDQGAITGDGDSLSKILATLKAKKLDPNQFIGKKWEGSTYAERKENRFLDIQDAEKIALGLSTGSSKIGPMTVKNQLEGLGTGTGTTTDASTELSTDTGIEQSNVPGTPIVPDKPAIEEQQLSKKTETTSLGLSDMFAPATKDINVESKYQHIGKAIQEQFGYADSMTMEGDNVILNFGGGNRRKHNAHLSITNMILRTSNLNQDDAAKEAKLHLDSLTVAPFMRLEKELKGKYTESQGGGAASIGAGNIDVLTTQIDGATLKTHIFNQIEALPKNRYGKPDSAILARFIQNIPNNFMMGTETFKTQIENAFKTEEIAFKLS